MHAEPIGIAIICAAVLALLLAVFYAARHNSREFAGMIRLPMIVMAVVVIGFGAFAVISTESSLDARDAAMQQRLQQAGVQLVLVQGGDDEVVVSKNDCVAAFRIQDPKATSYEHTWPLVYGTGQVLDGCKDVQLDKLFGL
jgi:hypothetical protein